MKKKQIQEMLSALKAIKMQKIEDKELRSQIIKIHFFLLSCWKKFDSDIDDLRTVYLGSYEEEINEFQELQVKANLEKDADKKQKLVDELNSHTELLSAITAFNKAAFDKGEEDIEVEKINAEKFIEEYSKQDYDMAVVEALVPILDV